MRFHWQVGMWGGLGVWFVAVNAVRMSWLVGLYAGFWDTVCLMVLVVSSYNLSFKMPLF